MGTSALAAIAAATSAAAPDKATLKTSGAAKDFEAFLVAQMLRSVREEGSGWLGTGEDQASEAAFGLGEEQFARALSAAGGLGLGRVIQAALDSPKNSPMPTPPPE